MDPYHNLSGILIVSVFFYFFIAATALFFVLEVKYDIGFRRLTGRRVLVI